MRTGPLCGFQKSSYKKKKRKAETGRLLTTRHRHHIKCSKQTLQLFPHPHPFVHFLRNVYEVTMEDYSVSSGPSCCSAPPPPPPPLLSLQGNLLIGMQAATWSRGALAPSLEGPAPRSSLFSFFLLVCPNALSLLPPFLAQLSQYLLATSAGGLAGVEEPG